MTQSCDFLIPLLPAERVLRALCLRSGRLKDHPLRMFLCPAEDCPPTRSASWEESRVVSVVEQGMLRRRSESRGAQRMCKRGTAPGGGVGWPMTTQNEGGKRERQQHTSTKKVADCRLQPLHWPTLWTRRLQSPAKEHKVRGRCGLGWQYSVRWSSQGPSHCKHLPLGWN